VLRECDRVDEVFGERGGRGERRVATGARVVSGTPDSEVVRERVRVELSRRGEHARGIVRLGIGVLRVRFAELGVASADDGERRFVGFRRRRVGNKRRWWCRWRLVISAQVYRRRSLHRGEPRAAQVSRHTRRVATRQVVQKRAHQAVVRHPARRLV